MRFVILIALPLVLFGIIYALNRSGLPGWLKFAPIAILAVFLVRVVVAIIGVFAS